MGRIFGWPESALKRGQFGGGATLWTPAQPTTDGEVLPHTWHYAGSGALYQDAAKITPATSDGDPVGASENQGSDSHDITQATGANKPTLKLSIRNGQSILRVDGGDWLRGAFGGGAIAQPITQFVVAQLATGSVNDNAAKVLCDGDDGVNRCQIYKDSASTPDAWSGFAGSPLTGGAADDDWNIWSVVWNGGSTVGYQNGISEWSGNGGANSLDGLSVAVNGTGAAPWVGDIAEILIYSSNLSNTDKNQVGKYLSTKYDVSYTDI